MIDPDLLVGKTIASFQDGGDDVVITFTDGTSLNIDFPVPCCCTKANAEIYLLDAPEPEPEPPPAPPPTPIRFLGGVGKYAVTVVDIRLGSDFHAEAIFTVDGSGTTHYALPAYFAFANLPAPFACTLHVGPATTFNRLQQINAGRAITPYDYSFR